MSLLLTPSLHKVVNLPFLKRVTEKEKENKKQKVIRERKQATIQVECFLRQNTYIHSLTRM